MEVSKYLTNITLAFSHSVLSQFFMDAPPYSDVISSSEILFMTKEYGSFLLFFRSLI